MKYLLTDVRFTEKSDFYSRLSNIIEFQNCWEKFKPYVFMDRIRTAIQYETVITEIAAAVRISKNSCWIYVARTTRST